MLGVTVAGNAQAEELGAGELQYVEHVAVSVAVRAMNAPGADDRDAHLALAPQDSVVRRANRIGGGKQVRRIGRAQRKQIRNADAAEPPSMGKVHAAAN